MIAVRFPLHWSAFALVALASVSCTDHQKVSIADVGWGLTRGTISDSLLGINIAFASDSGTVVPRADQAEHGALHIRFTLSSADQGSRYRYMVYYRNESYRFPEIGNRGDQHPLAHENFYGGFPDGFHVSPAMNGTDLIIDEELVIRCDPRNEFPMEPWGRNPRVGRYSLLLVAVPETAWNEHPPARGAIDLAIAENDRFIEPYWYWIHGPGKDQPGATVQVVKDVVRLYLALDLSLGVKGCAGNGGHLCSFIHHIDPTAHFDNVPVVADMSTLDYTPAMFDSMLCFTPGEQRVRTLPSVPTDPCLNMRYDTTERCMKILNPAATMERLRKENTGIRTRTALTYGRFRAHCRLAPLLNDSDLWNGLTNAIWLIGARAEGLRRRTCEGGYRAYGGDGPGTERRPTSVYAEIDFEIMKGMPWCPERAFPPIYPQQIADPDTRSSWLRELPLEVKQQRGNVAVACTNWDLACPDPPGFGSGCHDVPWEGRLFSAHRWNNDHRAVIEKSMWSDDALFGPDGYWFEIDWRPEEIIWRIGPSLDNMRTVGYMNSSMTSVPEIPMWLVITQEFHSTQWWPGSPYDQAGVPFPAKDLVGRVFAITVD